MKSLRDPCPTDQPVDLDLDVRRERGGGPKPIGSPQQQPARLHLVRFDGRPERSERPVRIGPGSLGRPNDQTLSEKEQK